MNKDRAWVDCEDLPHVPAQGDGDGLGAYVCCGREHTLGSIEAKAGGQLGLNLFAVCRRRAPPGAMHSEAPCSCLPRLGWACPRVALAKVVHGPIRPQSPCDRVGS